MKNNSLPIVGFLAVLAAAIFLPVGAGITSLAVTMAGALAILAVDYGRNLTPLRASSSVIPFEQTGRSPAALRRAA